MFLKLNNNHGDTIVEVLIAIAIVSLTLAGGYASANHSANATRTSQERGEALKWAETQVEQIKASQTEMPSTTTDFCYDTSLTLSTNTPCTLTNGIDYKAKISQTTPGSFSVMVTWDPIDTSSTVNNVELDYVK